MKSEFEFPFLTAPKNRGLFRNRCNCSNTRPYKRDRPKKRERQTSLSGPISTADHHHSGRAVGKDSASQRGSEAGRKRGRLRSRARCDPGGGGGGGGGSGVRGRGRDCRPLSPFFFRHGSSSSNTIHATSDGPKGGIVPASDKHTCTSYKYVYVYLSVFIFLLLI